jgi:hypothetical protein
MGEFGTETPIKLNEAHKPGLQGENKTGVSPQGVETAQVTGGSPGETKDEKAGGSQSGPVNEKGFVGGEDLQKLAVVKEELNKEAGNGGVAAEGERPAGGIDYEKQENDLAKFLKGKDEVREQEFRKQQEELVLSVQEDVERYGLENGSSEEGDKNNENGITQILDENTDDVLQDTAQEVAGDVGDGVALPSENSFTVKVLRFLTAKPGVKLWVLGLAGTLMMGSANAGSFDSKRFKWDISKMISGAGKGWSKAVTNSSKRAHRNEVNYRNEIRKNRTHTGEKLVVKELTYEQEYTLLMNKRNYALSRAKKSGRNFDDSIWLKKLADLQARHEGDQAKRIVKGGFKEEKIENKDQYNREKDETKYLGDVANTANKTFERGLDIGLKTIFDGYHKKGR